MPLLGKALKALALAAMYSVGLPSCGGASGGVASEAGQTSIPAPAASASNGWRVTVYYTAVMAYYAGSPQPVYGCLDLDCTKANVLLGTFPNDFVAVVKTEGTGKIANGSYLNWSSDVGYWHDTSPR
ncbi:MAG: hypothetical protein M3N19_07900, partial [Candidatus Eremiobacteraeota bacterium]|nr:hypothetical protein [Candidatus Eremiobacteraeota bacterium]